MLPMTDNAIAHLETSKIAIALSHKPNKRDRSDIWELHNWRIVLHLPHSPLEQYHYDAYVDFTENYINVTDKISASSTESISEGA